MLLLFLYTPLGQAYLASLESGELPEDGIYRLGITPGFLLSPVAGAGIGVLADRRVSESSSFRAELGVGEVDLSIGGSFKWILIPDFDKQPAVGLKLGATFGVDEGDSLTLFSVQPLMSKIFQVHASGRFVPYVGLPIGFGVFDGKSESMMHMVLGTEAQLDSLPSMEFAAELGFSIRNASDYFSVLVSFFFDENFKFKTRR